MKRGLLLLLALTVLSACETGPSAFDRRLAADREEFRRKLDDIPWKEFRDHRGIDECARSLAFGKSITDTGWCNQYKDRSETQAKIRQVKDEFEKLNHSPSMAEVIKAGKLRMGMTKEEVRLSWGSPNTTNRTVTSESTHSQWVYGDEYNPKTYLYFDNDKLTAWQD